MSAAYVWVVTDCTPRNVGTKVKEYARVLAACLDHDVCKATADALSAQGRLSIGYEGPVPAHLYPVGHVYCINEG